MFVSKECVPVKPYLSYAMVQGQEHRTLQVKGHTSMRAAERHSLKAMRELRTAIEAERATTGPVLMSWGYQKIEDHERQRGIIL